MKRTALFAIHQQLGATVTEFAGWQMPLSYSSILSEAQAVRQAAGLFDVSHMGVIEVLGQEARRALDYLFTCHVASLPVGRVRYGLLLNPEGGILDDVLLYALAPDRFWVVANAANAERDLAWIQEHTLGRVQVEPHFGRLTILALQGPAAVRMASDALGRDFSSLPRSAFTTWSADGEEWLASRTGYTGEDGLEFFCPASSGEALWGRLLSVGAQQGLKPCGLGARDVLRIEAGNPLYGHEIHEAITPLEANLMRAVHLDKDDFIGRNALQQALADGIARRLVGLVMEERTVPRPGAPVGTNEEATGAVTSGTFSPTLGQAVGMAYLPPTEGTPGQWAWVQLRGKRRRARITTLPFYRRA